ncbi:S9 family peptidase [Candidatus Poribacteria bacterium]|nr:S9 family peptidase [Candidatus Poribacteria bacterium]
MASDRIGGAIEYPATRRVDHVDTHHGRAVADPYRWLEDDVRESEDVAAWVAAQNVVTAGVLSAIPTRRRITERLTALWDYERHSTPFRRGGQYYYRHNDGLQNQRVLYTQDTLDGDARVFIDPNTWSDDGTVALSATVFSDDGRYVAYGVSEAGSDWKTWRVMDIGSGDTLADEVRWAKYGDVAWAKDGRGFFYGRFDSPEEGDEYQDLNFNHKVYYHRVGAAQAHDVLVYARPDNPEWEFVPRVTYDGRYLILTIWKGTDSKHRVVYRDLDEPYATPVDLVTDFEHEYSFVGNDGPLFYFETDRGAPRRRLVAVDIRRPEESQHGEVIAESEDTLTSVRLINNLFVATYLHDAQTQVRIYAKDGSHVRDVLLPGIGVASGFRGRPSDTETFYAFSSFAVPTTIYRYDMVRGESRLLRASEADVDSDAYATRQVFYRSKDGTRVPMFITHRVGLELDGSNATLRYGYGGFNASMRPFFSIARLAWMEMGGVFALANLRGGGEYGEEWHKAGTKLNKQNVFDNFIGAAEWLIDEGYTRPAKLAIQGASNGGLLVGAAMTQRPELFGACLPAVGVMDMLRFHLFTAGRYWVDDYGSADDPDEFAALLAYSPYHSLREGVRYPATLVTTADTDDRVVPGHSFKFAAALQHAQAGDAPTLIRIETRAGHGAGKPTSKAIEEAADQWAFLTHALEMDLPDGYPR